MSADIPLACNMGVFTAEERDTHIQNTTQLMQTVQGVREIEAGYEFEFPDTSQTLLKVIGFVSQEQRCCPFLEFKVQVPPRNEPLLVAVTGPEGTREFLRMEFEDAFR